MCAGNRDILDNNVDKHHKLNNVIIQNAIQYKQLKVMKIIIVEMSMKVKTMTLSINYVTVTSSCRKNHREVFFGGGRLRGKQ